MTWYYWLVAAVAFCSTCFGYVLCALLSCRSREDEREESRRWYEARVGEMCARCRAMDEERADAREWEHS